MSYVIPGQTGLISPGRFIFDIFDMLVHKTMHQVVLMNVFLFQVVPWKTSMNHSKILATHQPVLRWHFMAPHFLIMDGMDMNK